MMLELLVAGLCLGDYKCDQAAKAYYASSPNLRLIVKEKRKVAVKKIGKFAVYSAPVLVSLASGKVPQIKISRYFSCGANQNDVLCLYTHTF